MKTKAILSTGLTWGFAAILCVCFSATLTSCYTVMKSSTGYYSEFSSTDDDAVQPADSVYEEDAIADSALAEGENPNDSDSVQDDQTVIINRYYYPYSPWYTGGWAYYPGSSWGVYVGYGAYPYYGGYWDPYWVDPFYRYDYYYWGGCYYPNYYHHNGWWHHPYPYSWGGGVSYDTRRNFGVRRYAVRNGTGSTFGNMTGTRTSSAISGTGNSSRQYRTDGTSTSTGSKAVKTSKEKNAQRKYKSDKDNARNPGKSGSATGRDKSKRQVRDNSGNRRQVKPKEQNKTRDNGGTSGKEHKQDNSSKRDSGRDYNSGSNSGRDYGSSGRSSNSGRSSGSSSSGSHSGRSFRPNRR